MQKILSFFTLFGSASTLICCALPALFVSLGAGAVFASLVTRFPQLIWISEHKISIFIFATVMMVFGGFAQWNARNLPCPIDPVEARTCMRARKVSKIVYAISLVLLLVGAGFAFIPELLSR